MSLVSDVIDACLYVIAGLSEHTQLQMFANGSCVKPNTSCLRCFGKTNNLSDKRSWAHPHIK